MNKLYILCLCLAILITAEAQTFNYTGIEIKNEKVKKKSVYEKEHFILANYAIAATGHVERLQHAFGLTYGQVKTAGWYAGFMMGTGFHWAYDYELQGETKPFYTGKFSDNLLSVHAGGIVRLVIPLFLYLGTGYGYNSYTSETAGGQWVINNAHEGSSPHCQEWEGGFQGHIKGFTLNGGVYILTNYEVISLIGVKIGLGWTFKTKKQ